MLVFFICIYLLITILIGWFSSKLVKSSIDYVLAGRKMPVYMVASGLFATWFGSETILGASSEFLEGGILGIIEDPFGAALCLFLIGLFYAKPLYKLNLYTFSDYFRIRFGKKVELISVLFMVPSYFGWIAAQLVAMAVILQSIAAIPFTIGIVFCGAIVLFYTYLGGMWSISITDTIQTVLIIVGLAYIAFQLWSEIPDINKLISDLPAGFFDFTPKNKTGKDWMIYFGAWVTIGLGSIPQQDVFQRVLSAESQKTAVRGSFISAFMYLTVAIFPLIIVLCGVYLYPELKTGDLQMMIPKLILTHSSLFIQVIFFGALLSAIMSTCSAAILAPSTVIAENLIKPLFKNELSDASLLRIMRYSTVLITVAAIVLSLNQRDIYELVGSSSVLSLVALFIPLTAGLFLKKANSTGAILSMILGTTVWIVCEYFETEYPANVLGLLASSLGLSLGYIFPNLIENSFDKK